MTTRYRYHPVLRASAFTMQELLEKLPAGYDSNLVHFTVDEFDDYLIVMVDVQIPFTPEEEAAEKAEEERRKAVQKANIEEAEKQALARLLAKYGLPK